MKSRAGSMSGYEFLRAAKVEKLEAELAQDIAISISIQFDTQPGVVRIRLEAWEVETPGALPTRPIAAETVFYPGPRPMSFEAALFQGTVALTRLVEDGRRDVWAGTLAAQMGG